MAYIAFTHSGPPDAVERDTVALSDGPEPALTIGGPTDYLQIQTANDEAMAAGKRSWNDSQFATGLRPETIDRLLDHVADAPGEAGFGVSAFGGAVGRVDDDATAFPSRTIQFDYSADAGMWEDPADDETNIGWARGAMAIAAADAAPFGRYTNESLESGEHTARSIWGEAKLARIAALKRQWDPDNLFQGNHNVRPA
jgi:hypothetical protein